MRCRGVYKRLLPSKSKLPSTYLLILQIPNLNRSFNAVYVAWLDIRAGIRHRVNVVLSSVTAAVPPSIQQASNSGQVQEPLIGEEISMNDVQQQNLQQQMVHDVQIEGQSIKELSKLLDSEVSKSDWRAVWRNPEPLCLRCPCCFSTNEDGTKAESGVVVLDGNFSQKRMGGKSVVHRNKRPDNRLFVTPDASFHKDDVSVPS